MSYTAGVLSLVKRLVKGSKLTKAEMDQNLSDVEEAVNDRYTKGAMDTALGGKADSSHTHAWSAISGKPSTFTPASHTHPQAEVTNLISDLTTLDTAIGLRMQFYVFDVNADYNEIPKFGHNVILVDCTGGDVVVTLEAATTKRQVTVIKTDSSINIVTVDANTGRTIEGNSTEDITTQYGKLKLVYDGVNTFYKL